MVEWPHDADFTTHVLHAARYFPRHRLQINNLDGAPTQSDCVKALLNFAVTTVTQQLAHQIVPNDFGLLGFDKIARVDAFKERVHKYEIAFALSVVKVLAPIVLTTTVCLNLQVVVVVLVDLTDTTAYAKVVLFKVAFVCLVGNKLERK